MDSSEKTVSTALYSGGSAGCESANRLTCGDAEIREPRAESREPRAESREPRAESREPRLSSCPPGRVMPRLSEFRSGRPPSSLPSAPLGAQPDPLPTTPSGAAPPSGHRGPAAGDRHRHGGRRGRGLGAWIGRAAAALLSGSAAIRVPMLADMEGDIHSSTLRHSSLDTHEEPYRRLRCLGWTYRPAVLASQVKQASNSSFTFRP